MVLSNCASRKQSWAAKNSKLTIHAINGCDDAPIFVPDDATRRLCQKWSGIFRAGDYGIPAGQADTMLLFVVPALREMNWAIEFSALEEMLASKRESAPGPDWFPYSVYRSAGGVGAKFPCATTKRCSWGRLSRLASVRCVHPQ